MNGAFGSVPSTFAPLSSTVDTSGRTKSARGHRSSFANSTPDGLGLFGQLGEFEAAGNLGDRGKQAQVVVRCGPCLTARAASDRMCAMRLGVILVTVVGLFSSSLPLMAHHSFAAEYDSRKTIT